jgi:hypothetical protein
MGIGRRLALASGTGGLLGFLLPFGLIGGCAEVQDSYPPGCGQAMVASGFPWVAAVVGASLGAIVSLLLPSRR